MTNDGSRRMNILRALLSWLGLTAFAAACLPSAASSEPVLVATPDTPVNFGYKVNWFAVKTEQPTLVAQTLNLTNRRQANWKTGRLRSVRSRGFALEGVRVSTDRRMGVRRR